MSTQTRSKGADVISSSLYAGAATGILGASLVAGHATLKGRSALLWGGVAGGQCFILGSSFWFSRTFVRGYLKEGESSMGGRSSQNDLMSSGVAGAFAGMAGGALRGPRNILPGAVMFSLIGLSGQVVYAGFERYVESSHQRRPMLDILSDSSWWPLKSISDADYEHELTEKIISIDAEISLIDEKIAGLRQKISEAPPKTS